MMLSLLALAVAPGTAIALYIYSRDKYDREPLKPLLISFLLGMAAILPAKLIQGSLQPVLYKWFPGYTLSYYSLLAFVLIAVSEECSKFLALRFYAYPHKAFDEPFDGIIYSVMVSMGFATLENLEYVLMYGYKTGFVRMFLSVPSHAAFGVLMGYHLGVAKFRHTYVARHMLEGLLLAIIFHGAFDFFLLLQGSLQVRHFFPNKFVFNAAIVTAVLLCYGTAITMSLRAIRLHETLSKQTFHEKNGLPIT